ncbi:hypothetical protein CesoFtcFv8_001791 [Champsocephalus esox]|uniref:Uncharacterized protein n=1 Tax=Champsocephalus esox TaxID=159716 RepID=A0AAN8HDX2_9TELE|nr:hypothetical protein CesoFtcFv8_001791 [Champsocephalus esox]
MASRLTELSGRWKRESVIKGSVFTNTTPWHIKPGPRRPLAPAQLHQHQRPVCNLAPLIKRDTMQCYHASSRNTTPPQQHSVCNRKCFNPPTPCIHWKECR